MRRIAAMLYDGLLLLAVLMLVTLPFVAIRGGEAVPPLTDPFFRITLALTIYFFFVGFWTWKGRTLGMQSWRLQLETMDGQPVRVPAASLRFLAAIFSWFALGLGFLWSLVDRDKLAWHDRISGTRLAYYPKDS